MIAISMVRVMAAYTGGAAITRGMPKTSGKASLITSALRRWANSTSSRCQIVPASIISAPRCGKARVSWVRHRQRLAGELEKKIPEVGAADPHVADQIGGAVQHREHLGRVGTTRQHDVHRIGLDVRGLDFRQGADPLEADRRVELQLHFLRAG